MFESTEVNVLEQCMFLLVIIINVKILLYVKQHLVYLNPKINLKINYKTGFDWVVLVTWTKSHFICMCTISIDPPICVLLQVDTHDYVHMSTCVHHDMKQSEKLHLKIGKCQS